MSSDHPDLPAERANLDRVKGEIQTQFRTARESLGQLNEEEWDEARERTLAQVQSEALEHLSRERALQLAVARQEPYFGRFDFQAHDETKVKPYYVGKTGLSGPDNQPMVIDWRAPVASLFYTSSGGKAVPVQYEAPEGIIKGAMSLKRNLVIRQGKLQRVVDSQAVPGVEPGQQMDEFLAYRLQESRDNRLRDIVSTIQGEQNQIIRAPLEGALIIQGAAGSGKTTVALHRLAYLLYHYQGRVAASRVVIFAPNRIFLDYISSVLPELGVGGVKQTTFNDWALQALDWQAKLADPTVQAEEHFALKPKHTGAEAAGAFKGGLWFRDVLDIYLRQVGQNFVPRVPLQLWEGGPTLNVGQFSLWYNQQGPEHGLMGRRDRVLARARRWVEVQIGTRLDPLKRRSAQTAYRKWRDAWPKFDALALYRNLFEGKLIGGEPNVASDELPAHLVKPTLALLKKKLVLPEDLTPLLYLHDGLWGQADLVHLDHVVIDEAQDFSTFQLWYLQQRSGTDSFTILGDLAQGIHGERGITVWEDLAGIFPPESLHYHVLTKSYRSTMEVIKTANLVLKQTDSSVPLAEPVFRSGEPVHLGERTDSDLARSIARTVTELKERDFASIAIIGRTLDQCAKLHMELLACGLEVSLLTPEQNNYRGGVSLLPVYLAKGMEFDAVVVANAGAQWYPESGQNAKLLYVACTRALHELYIFYTDKLTPWLAAAPEAQFVTQV